MEVYEKLTKGVRKPKKHKIALFLCGAAGTGKTTLKNKFLKDVGITTTYVDLNIDDVWRMTGKIGQVTPVFNSVLEKVISEGYSFVYDKTCRNLQETLSIMEHVKREGYTVKLAIVYSNLNTTLERIKKRKEQPLSQTLAKDIYTEFSRVAGQYMKLDEVFLYNNDSKSKLIYSKENQKILCVHPELDFYFDIKPYCKES